MSTQKKLLIIGTGDYAEMASLYIQRDLGMEPVAYAVEREYLTGTHYLDKPLVAFEDLVTLYDPEHHQVLVAIGPNRVNSVRQRLYEMSVAKGYSILTYISPKAHVWSYENVGQGSFIFDGCIIEPGVSIGENCILWSGATVAHHSSIEAHCFLAPQASVSGRITIGRNSFLGINSTIRDNVIIAPNCIIGGGAVIKKDTVEGGVYSAPNTPLRNDDSFNTKV